MFQKILIANRGEIAIRITRAARDLGIKTVAVYSEGDKQSTHIDMADERICIGGFRSDESYLAMTAILQAAESSNAQAIHPGYGFLSENALFAARCLQHRITFIGPTCRAIQLMGDKAVAKKTMRKAGLPTIPGSEGLIAEVQDAQKIADEIGYPILLKATAGGGGKGMRICTDRASLCLNFSEAQIEADKAFGNSALYLEKYITGGRHIEFQILADNFGNAVHLGERECSIQRKNQKLVEESPSAAISSALRHELGAKVVQAIQIMGYVNAGTVEFLMSPEGDLYFMEMNTRLQVEHPVTEMTTSVDIVKEQIKIAANYRMTLHQQDILFSGHSIECRINAEDPENGFIPNPGTITRFSLPESELNKNVRLDTHVREGYVIPPFYDSLIGKLIVHGETRLETIDLMKKVLQRFTIEGVKTTIPLHIAIMENEVFRSGFYNTNFIPDVLKL